STPETCQVETCDVNAAITNVSACGSPAWCHGNGQCSPPPTMCTVTGSTVIDLQGTARPPVRSHCGYTLLQPRAAGGRSPAFAVVAVFRERRRRDVPLLDRVMLFLTERRTVISLEQGGRVQVNNETVSLGPSPRLVQGVELSKSEAGVTATILFSNNSIPVMFNGFTAHVDLTGVQNDLPDQSQLISCCLSPPSCETQYNDSADSTIDCRAATARCDLLRQEPFTACNKHMDPEPYITACTDMLCRYPAVDDVHCQLMEAYATACQSHSNDTLSGWRSKARCSTMLSASCQDKFCAPHEFCGERMTIDGQLETACLCRAAFASRYRENTFGEPAVCQQDSASLTLAACLLEEKHIDCSLLHLNDHTCRGKMDNLTRMVTFGYDMKDNSCGTVLMVGANDTHLLYKNAVLMGARKTSGLITRQRHVEIGFSCFYNQPEMSGMIKIKQSPVIQQMVSGALAYSVIMNIYTDPEYKHAVNSSTEIQLNQRMWVELKTEGLDNRTVAMVTDSCWATVQPSSNESLRYNLIVKGCANPADHTVRVEGNGMGTFNHFSFSMFQFSGKTGDIYLHCKLRLCAKQGRSCVPNCGAAGRHPRRASRSHYADENPALITMAWTN
uniref:ZP domain-containing protein n=1 Tax=Myripristis murdjan TaxID=586833 RepID=A0A667XTE8_9TELE